jgi:hypothetical protein
LGFEILPFKFYSKFRVLAGKTKYLAPKMQLGQPIATISWQWVWVGWAWHSWVPLVVHQATTLVAKAI